MKMNVDLPQLDPLLLDVINWCHKELLLRRLRGPRRASVEHTCGNYALYHE